MNKTLALHTFLLVLLALAPLAHGQIEVTSITASPDPFNPDVGETTTVTVNATPGLTILELRVFQSDQVTLMQSGLALTETTAGVYTAVWEGKYPAATTGIYYFRVLNKATSAYAGPWGQVAVQGIATSVSASPNPFTPTGSNTTTITVEAAPGQTGMYFNIVTGYGGYYDWNWDSYTGKRLYLTETATPGLYTGEWSAAGHSGYGVETIWPDKTYNIFVYDSTGNRSATTGQVTLSGVSSVSCSPSQFNAAGGESTMITVEGATGLDLEAKIYRQGESNPLRTLLLSGTGPYMANWDGRDKDGTLLPVGTYSIMINSSGGSVRYYPTTSVQISAGVISVSASPDPFTPTGSNTTTITVQATPGQTGMYAMIYHPAIWWWMYSKNFYLLESSTPGMYTTEWTAIHEDSEFWPDGICTIYVYDSSGNQSATTGQVTLSGVSSVSCSPSQFNAAGGETTTITAEGVNGLSLEAKIYDSVAGNLLRTLSLTGTGPYTAIWDGKDSDGNLLSVGTYEITVIPAGISAIYNFRIYVQITAGVTSISASPDPFTPTGSNSTTITVEAEPGQTGMYATIYHPAVWWWMHSKNFYLPESSTPGMYTTEWTAVHDDSEFWPDGICTIYVYDSSGNRSATTGQVTLSGVSSVSCSPSQFNAAGGETTMITVEGATGLDLEAKIYREGENNNLQILALSGSGPYTVNWDGKDKNGNLLQAGNYNIYIYYKGNSNRYYPATTVKILWSVISVTASPDPFTPTGSNSTTITVEAEPGQSGLYVDIYHPGGWPWWWWGGNYLPLTETSNPGTYTVEWSSANSNSEIWPDGICTIYVYDSFGNQSVTTGQITLTGVASLTCSPYPFTPGGGNRATFTADGGSGLNLELKITNQSTNTLTRTLALTESSGIYTADWDGKDDYGNYAGAGWYNANIYNKDSGYRYNPSTSIHVNVAVFSIAAAPDPFEPDGGNQVTITARADPLQAGFTARVSHPQSGMTDALPMLEKGTDGTYTTTWDGKINGALVKRATCVIYIYDGSGNQFPETGTLTILSPANKEPVAHPDAIITNEDTPVAIILTGSDAEGSALTYTIVDHTDYGSLGGQAPNLTYIPYTDYHGLDSLTFLVNDGELDSATAVVSITITSVNDAPAAGSQNVATQENTPHAITLSGTDADGDPLSYRVVREPLHGGLNGIAPDLTYTPEAQFNGADSFQYIVNDGQVDSATATVGIIVLPVNETPIAHEQNVDTNEDTPVPLTLTGSDGDGDPLTYILVAYPGHGAVVGTPPVLTYTPSADYHGGDQLIFKVHDGQVDSPTAAVNLTIHSVNDTPVADVQSIQTQEDTPVSITLTGSDADSDPLTWQIVQDPSHGSLTGTLPNLTYTPVAEYMGQDQFKFKISDGQIESSTAAISITINPVNDLPVAHAQSVTTNEDTPVSITLTASDPDGDSLTFVIATGPVHGALSGTLPRVTYHPAADYHGSDSFTFRVNDRSVNSPAAIVGITIHPVNDAPVANDASVVTIESTPVSISFPATDVEGDSLTFTINSEPSHGVLSGTPPLVTYTPRDLYIGSDSFTFHAKDGNLESNLATIHLTIKSKNSEPVANPDAVVTDEDTPVSITLTGSDADGDPLTYAISTPPAHGSLTGTPPNVIYTPNENYFGEDSFSFHSSDGQLESQEATVRLTIRPVNDAPVAGDDTAVTWMDHAVDIPVLANDADGDGDGLLISSLTQGATGAVINNGSIVTYNPQPGFVGNDSFTYTASDGQGGSSTGTVHVEVYAPVTVDAGSEQIQEFGESFNLQALVSGGDGSYVISWSILSGPETDAALFSNPAITNPRFTVGIAGTYTLRITADDQNCPLASGTLKVTSTHRPVADDLHLTTDESHALTVFLPGEDIDQDPLTYMIQSQPQHGILSPMTPTLGIVTYTPFSGYIGEDRFSYSVTDGFLTSPTQSVNVLIQRQTIPFPTPKESHGESTITPTPVPATVTPALTPGADTPVPTEKLPTPSPVVTLLIPTSTPTGTPASLPSFTPTESVSPEPEDTKTTTPTVTSTPISTPTPTPTPTPTSYAGEDETLEVFDNPSSTIPQTGQTDFDTEEERVLVIRWIYHGHLPVRDWHIYAKINDGGYFYLGRTGSGLIHEFTWTKPEFNTEYQFRVWGLYTDQENRIRYVVLTQSGPMGYNLAGGQTIALKKIANPTDLLPGTAIVVDDLYHFNDLSGGTDSDLPDQRAIGLQFNPGISDCFNVHVYVSLNGHDFNYLGQTGAPDLYYFRFDACGTFSLDEAWAEGPQDQTSYWFRVFALKSGGGFIRMDTGPVFYTWENPPLSPENPAVEVYDDENSRESLTGRTDFDDLDNRKMSIRWNYDEPLSITDWHVYVRKANGGYFYLSRTGAGTSREFTWLNPDINAQYQFRIWGIYQTDTGQNRWIVLNQAGPIGYNLANGHEIKLMKISNPEDVPAGQALVTDDLFQGIDLSESSDSDSILEHALVMKWNPGDDVFTNSHVYISTDGVNYQFLGQTGAGDIYFFRFDGKATFALNPLFHNGPMNGETYWFRIFTLRKDGSYILMNTGKVTFQLH